MIRGEHGTRCLHCSNTNDVIDLSPYQLCIYEMLFLVPWQNDFSMAPLLHQYEFLCAVALNVGSCPNDDNFVKTFCPFLCVVFKLSSFLNLFLPRKPQDFADNSCFFVCLFLSHARKWVTSDIILYFFFLFS